MSSQGFFDQKGNLRKSRMRHAYAGEPSGPPEKKASPMQAKHRREGPKKFARSMICRGFENDGSRLLRHPSLDGALGETTTGAGLVAFSGRKTSPKPL